VATDKSDAGRRARQTSKTTASYGLSCVCDHPFGRPFPPSSHTPQTTADRQVAFPIWPYPGLSPDRRSNNIEHDRSKTFRKKGSYLFGAILGDWDRRASPWAILYCHFMADMLHAERRTPNAERRTPNAERRTPNAERRTPNAERRHADTPNAAPSFPLDHSPNAGYVAEARERFTLARSGQCCSKAAIF
jgi:hypothetical protein